MFKNTSANMESRARRTTVETRVNTDIDPTAFADGLAKEYTNLVVLKKELERQLSSINEQIKHAGRRAHLEGKYVGRSTFERWLKYKDELKAKMYELDRKIIDVRTKRKQANLNVIEHQKELQEHDFKYVFYHLAKEMLAGPVFDRIVTATIHRLKENE